MDLGPYLAFNGANYECTICDRLFSSEIAVYAHCRSTSRHLWCESKHYIYPKCPQSYYFYLDYKLYYNSFKNLQEHDVTQHHLCIKYGNYFANKNNLQMWILIHLESGNCVSECTEEEIDDIARQCYQSGKYINTGLEDGEWSYRCPSCDYEFVELSALYQHAEDVQLCSSLLTGFLEIAFTNKQRMILFSPHCQGLSFRMWNWTGSRCTKLT
ncbi:hypothetical protein BJY00DRAFT_302818 [Aspergillus carlsbadensis]|nr:hypothetical protein BJY00DRAFT_302818 [Aspergillus carlsbadensis]